MTEKKRLLRVFYVSMLLVFAVMFSTNRVSASNYTLSLSDTWTPMRTITDSDTTHFYRFSLSSAGWFTATYQAWSIGDGYFEIFDGDLTTSYNRSNLYNASDTSPQTKTVTLLLEAGSYIVKVYPYGSHRGDYRLKASFGTAGGNDRESNNSFSTAQTLSNGVKVWGVLSVQDRLDTYRLHVNRESLVTITYQPRIGDSYITIWNGDFNKVYSKNIYNCSESNPGIHEWKDTLSAGDYYIQITPYGSNTGRYQLSATGITSSSPDPVPTTTLGKISKVTAGTSTLTSVTFSWTAATGATGYNIAMYNPNTSSWSVQTRSGTRATISGLTPETKYTFKITPYSVSNGSKKLGTATGSFNLYTSTRTPSVPTFKGKCTYEAFSANDPGIITVRWGKVSNATGYILQYRARTSNIWHTKSFSPQSKLEGTVSLTPGSYMLRMRTYRKKNGMTAYSAFTSAQGVTVTIW